MSIFQLDECADSRHLVRACKEEGSAQVYRFPGRLKTKEAREQRKQKDASIIPEFLSGGIPFVTTDKPIIEENLSSVPFPHSGVIIISNAQPVPEVGREDIINILSTFKRAFPGWHEAKWDNSIVELTDKWIEVKRIESGDVVSLKRLSFDEENWSGTLASLLAENRQRSQAGQFQLPTDYE